MKDTSANIEKAESLLGWKPQVSLEEGIDRTIEWYLANKDWVSQVDVQL